MPTTSSPVWNAAQAGLIGNAAATAASAQVNQLLTTHPDTVLYQGASALTPIGQGGSGWSHPIATLDADQPFTMSGTVVGRVDIPVLAVGSGADLLVSLCADNGSGKPGTMITQAHIPAKWITQLSAVTGQGAPSTQYPALSATNNALATGRFNPLRAQYSAFIPYAYPAVTGAGVAATATGAYYDTGAGTGYLFLMGGVNSGAALTNTFSITVTSSGDVSRAIPQPALPQAGDGSGRATVCVESSGSVTLVLIGGATTFGGTPSSAVYTSAVDAATGNLGAWSSQTALPVNIQNQIMIAYNGYVYVIGGWSSPTGTVYNTVYYAQVQNGQITGWNTIAPFPGPISLAWVAILGGNLFVGGGGTTTGFATTTASYYATINPSGTLGPWVPGPAMPASALNVCGYALTSPFGIEIPGYPTGSDSSFSLGFTENGPGAYWVNQNAYYGSGSDVYVSSGAGTYQLFSFNYLEENYVFEALGVTPTISVPLPATGLSSGSTYHILMQQQGGDLNDYLVLWDDFEAYSGNPTLLSSASGAYSWTAVTAGHCVPIQVFDQTVIGPPLHTWADNGARITTLVNATTPDQRLLGLCEATRMGLALNQNQGFETGISPWTVTGGTVAQSTTRSYSGLHSAQITPDGVSASCSLTSEIMPCMPGQAVTAAGRFQFTSSLTSEFSLSITWWTAVTGGISISTTTTLASASAATWTEQVNNLTAVNGAYGWQLDAVLSGTPAASQVWFADAVYGTYTYTGQQQSTVTAINYSGAWPSTGTWPPLGSTVLA